MKNLIQTLGRITAISFVALTTEANTQVDFNDDVLFDPMLGEVPYVLSAVRLDQPTAEVPASVTVLDAQFIRATGAKNIQNLLRYVPGMLVVPEPYDNSDSIVYHGGPALYPKAMEVLVDGRTAYRSGVAAVGWSTLPITVEEIQRIEVVRGPNATSYGANAYQAVVNIITKHPSDTVGEHQFSIQAGNNNDHYLQGSSGFDFAGGQWRLSGYDKGTDHLNDSSSERLGCETLCEDRRDASAINLHSFFDLSPRQSLDTTLLYSRSHRKLPNYSVDENTGSDNHTEAGLRYYADLSPEHQIKISTFIYQYERYQTQATTSMPSGHLDPDLAALNKLNKLASVQIALGEYPSALDVSDPEQVRLVQILTVRYADPSYFLTPLSGTSYTKVIENRADIEIQDTLAIMPNLTLLSGIGYRLDRVSSVDYYGGEIENDSLRIFSNINWRATPRWALHAGFMNERSDLDRSALSLRAAANFLITPIESLRFVYSEATKTPDFLEQYANWTYHLENIETASPYSGEYFFQSFQVDGDLKSQHNRSYEIGYYGQSPRNKMSWDIRIFHEELTDLIYLWPSIISEQPYSNNRVTFHGIEWQASKTLNKNIQLRYIGAYTKADSDTEGNVKEEDILAIFSPLSQTFSVQFPLTDTTNSMLSFFWIKDLGGPSADDDETVDTQRIDLNIYGSINRVTLKNIGWAVNLQHDLSNDPYITNGRNYGGGTTGKIELSIAF